MDTYKKIEREIAKKYGKDKELTTKKAAGDFMLSPSFPVGNSLRKD